MDLNKIKRKKMKHSPVSLNSLLLLTLVTTSCVGQTVYDVRREYDLCNPKTAMTDPPRIYMEKPDVSTEIFVQWEFEPNSTSSRQCHMLLKSCPQCRIKVEAVEQSFYNPPCDFTTDTTECTPGCSYMYLYDNYYKNVSVKAFYSSGVNRYQSQSSELNVLACISTFNRKLNISMRLRFTVIEKLQEINGDPLSYPPRRTFTSPNFPNPYVSNSEIYRFEFQSSSLTDYITVSFDDWVVSPNSELLIENANLIKITGQNRRPYIISDGQSMSMQFNTGEFRTAGKYFAYLGFKAIATFYKDRSEIPEVQTDCGHMLIDSGGVITLSKIADGSIRDCIWIIKKTAEYDGVYLKLLRYRNGQDLRLSLYENKLEIKDGLTSTTDPLLNVNANQYGAGEGFDASSDVGFYIRLKGSYQMEDSLVISYAMYLTDCTNFNEYFKCGNGHCIQAFLKCDTYDHCGDKSDESLTLCNSGGGGSGSYSRSSDYPISIGVIIPMVVSVFLVIVMCLLIIFIRRCRRLNNGTFGNRPNGITQPNGRGRRRRRHNRNVQMSVTVSSGEHPPSYEEVIQNTPIGYLNMAFSWFQSDTTPSAPPSYEESIMPPPATPSQNAPPAAALGGSTGNLLLQGTATISTPQHQVSRATFMASLDPGAYVSSSSSSEYASEPENRLDLSSSSDTSDEHPSFLTNGINQNLSQRTSLDLNKENNRFSVAQNAGKTVSNSTHKPVSEGSDMQVELDDLSLSKNKTPVTAARPVERSRAEKDVRKNERNVRDNGHQGRRERRDSKETERKKDSQRKGKEDDAMRGSRGTLNDPESGSEGLYIKRNHKKPAKSGTGRPSHHSENASKITESSRSQSCFDLSLGGAVGGDAPSYGREEARAEDKRFSYAGYGDVSLKRDDLDPFCTGRGLVRDRPIENLNKYAAQSCDNLLQGYNLHANREHHVVHENPQHASSSCLDVSQDRKDKKPHHTSSLSLSKYSDTSRSLTPVPETGDRRPHAEPNRRAGHDKNRKPESHSARVNPDLKHPHSVPKSATDHEISAPFYQPEKPDQASKGAIPKSKPADMLTLMPGPNIVLSEDALRTTQYQEHRGELSPKSNSSRTHHNAKDSAWADSNEHKNSLSSKKPGLTLARDQQPFDNQRTSKAPDARLRNGQSQSHEPIYDTASPLHNKVRSYSESVPYDRSVSKKETPEPIYQRPDHSRENGKLKPGNTLPTDRSVHPSRGPEPIYQIPSQSRENNRLNSRESFPSEGNVRLNQGPEFVNKRPNNQSRDQPRSSLVNNGSMSENIGHRQETIYQVPRQSPDPPSDYLPPSQLRPSPSAGNVGQKPTPAPRQAKMSASKAERDHPPVPRTRSLHGKGQPDNRSSSVHPSQQPGHSRRPGGSTGDSSGNAARDQVEETELRGRPDQVVLALDPIFQANENDVFV